MKWPVSIGSGIEAFNFPLILAPVHPTLFPQPLAEMAIYESVEKNMTVSSMNDTRPKRCILIALTICAVSLQCRGYDLIIDQSAYRPHRTPTMSSWGQNVPYYMKEGDPLEYRGTYAVDPYSKMGLVRRFDRREGWSYVILSDPLPLEEGTMVSVAGRIVTVERPITGTGRTSRSKLLMAEDYQILHDTGPMLKKARDEYARIRGKLQDNISLPGSKLVLSEQPQWRVDWLKGEDALVVAAHCFDLMYAAEVQFLFSLKDERLQKVYFIEWFKGE
jgi:hypothetical protein